MTTTAITFDTLAYANKLKAADMDGHLAEVQAKAQAKILANLVEDKLAVTTKQDIDGLRQDFKQLRHEVKNDINVFRKDII